MDWWLALISLLILVAVLLATCAILLIYSGLLTAVDVGAGRPPIGQAVIAYKFARGPYKDVGPLFAQVGKIAPRNKCLGIYYDDPHKVEAKRLRHVTACVLAEGSQAVDEYLVKKFLAEGFRTFHLPEVEHVVRCSFPFITTLSIFIAVQKVYPRMMSYVKRHSLCAHPYLEIYKGKTIHFMAPLSQQDDFYVPEALQPVVGEESCDSYHSDNSVLDGSNLSASTEPSVSEPSVVESTSAVVAAPEQITGEGSLMLSPPMPEREERGSDGESTSSFEEVKFENGESK